MTQIVNGLMGLKNEIKLKDQEFGNEGEKIVEQGKRMVAEVNNELLVRRERARSNNCKLRRAFNHHLHDRGVDLARRCARVTCFQMRGAAVAYVSHVSCPK